MIVIADPDKGYLGIFFHSSRLASWTRLIHECGRGSEDTRPTMERTLNLVRDAGHVNAYIATLPDDFRSFAEVCAEAGMAPSPTPHADPTPAKVAPEDDGPWVVTKMLDDVPTYLHVNVHSRYDRWMFDPRHATTFNRDEVQKWADMGPGVRGATRLAVAIVEYKHRNPTPPEPAPSPAPTPAPVVTVRIAADQMDGIRGALAAILTAIDKNRRTLDHGG